MASHEDFRDHLAEALRDPNPSSFLELVSGVAAAALPRTDPTMPAKIEPKVPINEFAVSMVTADEPVTNAVLRVWAEMLGDDMLRRRVINSVSKHGHPEWLDDIAQLAPTRVTSLGDVYGEQRTYFVELTMPSHTFTISCAMLRLGAPMLEDVYAIPSSLDQVLDVIQGKGSLDVVRIDHTLAESAADLRDAQQMTDHTVPPIETDSWPMTRPLLEWALRLMPESGAPSREYSDSENQVKIDKFLREFSSSTWGKALTREQADHVPTLLSLHINYATGDLTRWGPMFVESLLCHLYPHKVMADSDFLMLLPTVLQQVVEFAHGEAALAPVHTSVTLRAISEYTPHYFDLIDELLDEDLDSELDDLFDGYSRGDALAQIVRDRISGIYTVVGGQTAFDQLTTTPLPDTPMDFSSVPEDVTQVVRNILAHVERVGETLFDDAELLSAARRLLTRIATEAPAIFRRRTKPETAAAAICWISAKNNDWFSTEKGTPRTVKRLQETFGVGSVQQRAETMMRGIGVEDANVVWDFGLGDVSLLTSTRRAELIALEAHLRGMLSDEPAH